MRWTSGIWAMGLMWGLGACATSQTSQPVAQHVATGSYCAEFTDLEGRVAEVYSPDRVRRVSPVYAEDAPSGAPRTRAGTATRPTYLAGARLTVPAERGVSAAYMERVLSCRVASQAGDPSDPLTTSGVRNVAVKEKGATFQVAVTGADASAGKAIWQRARALERGTHVEVRQLSANEQTDHAEL